MIKISDNGNEIIIDFGEDHDKELAALMAYKGLLKISPAQVMASDKEDKKPAPSPPKQKKKSPAQVRAEEFSFTLNGKQDKFRLAVEDNGTRYKWQGSAYFHLLDKLVENGGKLVLPYSFGLRFMDRLKLYVEQKGLDENQVIPLSHSRDKYQGTYTIAYSKQNSQPTNVTRPDWRYPPHRPFG